MSFKRISIVTAFALIATVSAGATEGRNVSQQSNIKIVKAGTPSKSGFQVEKSENITIIRPAGNAKTQAKVIKLSPGAKKSAPNASKPVAAEKSHLEIRQVYLDGTPVVGVPSEKLAKQIAKETKKQAAKNSDKEKKKQKKDKNGKLIEERAFYYGVMLPRDYKLISIFGTSEGTMGQAVAYLKDNNPNMKLSCSPEKLVQFYWEEAAKEGVRPDLAFCQAITETGFFRFGGTVTSKQNNFCGLGTTGGGVKGANFKTPQLGVRAHIQHLLAYSRLAKPKTDLVDPRYDVAHDIRIKRGLIDKWSGLNGTWAMGSEYCEKIMYHYAKLKATKAVAISTTVKPNSKLQATVRERIVKLQSK